jgi:predicted nuclease of restriction endonuclease-like (RecB) superfamily
MLPLLSSKLTFEFGRGFSEDNLSLMRRFYLMYSQALPHISEKASRKFSKTALQSENVTTQRSLAQFVNVFKLSWSHYVFLMSINDKAERGFYEIESANSNWSLPELKRQYSSSLYERLALSRNKTKVKELAEKGQLVENPVDVIKNPMVLEFLGLKEQSKFSESDLESAIINRLEDFLLEIGKGFLFEARQKRFTFDSDHFFVDLVFYNRLLRCYVLIDLKLEKLTHQDLGQMQMYVNYFDRHVRQADEHPTIGIILCKSKNGALVELTLPKDANIYASEYKLYLPSKKELQKKLIQWTRELQKT